jgi:RNA polymerase sigma factor (sigma-70 family)
MCPDVVIMDIAMPGMNGIEVTANIRRQCPSTHVVILSMYSTSEHIFRALKAGALGHILKESAAEEVVNAVHAVHAGQHYLCKKIDETMASGYINRQICETKSPLESLSPREREILQLVVEGRTSSEIGIILNLSPKTVETYRSRLMQKLNVNNIPGLVKFAINHRLTTE